MNRMTRWLRRGLALEGLDAPEHRRIVLFGLVIALLAMVLRIVFWAYTQRYWEDALITCLHSENFASGLGLTHYRPGEPPLHGFTSPLSVLVPLIGDLMHVGFGIEFLKLVSIPAGALTVLYILAIGLHPAVRFPKPLIGLAMAYAGFEHHQILWGMSGMETQLATLILIASIYYTIAWRPIPLGITLGLCMLARPDYAFWTLIVAAYALWRAWALDRPDPAGPRVQFRFPRELALIAGIALALYLPWIVFTLAHYGSPIPNTVIAKGLGYPQWWEKVPELSFYTIKRHTWMMLAEQIHLLLGPHFAGHGAGLHIFCTDGPESPIANLMFAFAVLGTLAILFRRQWPLWPLAACVVVYGLYYVYLVPVVFGWYKVPYILVMLLLSVRGLQALGALIPRPRWHDAALGAFAVVYIGLFAAVLPVTFHTERQIQRYIENPVRKAAGLYLREHMAEDEAVGCEPLGYMSYYSRGNVYDWPGLASRTVVEWSKANPGKRNLEHMLKGLQPEYLFLRDIEILYMFKDPEWFKRHYHVVKVFALDWKKRKRIRWVDRNVDTIFRIYKKNHPEDERPYDQSLWPRREDSPAHPAEPPPNMPPPA